MLSLPRRIRWEYGSAAEKEFTPEVSCWT